MNSLKDCLGKFEGTIYLSIDFFYTVSFISRRLILVKK